MVFEILCSLPTEAFHARTWKHALGGSSSFYVQYIYIIIFYGVSQANVLFELAKIQQKTIKLPNSYLQCSSFNANSGNDILVAVACKCTVYCH